MLRSALRHFGSDKRYLLAGMRPINNAVDITNYILLKTGQPLHAFDFDQIEGGILSVQTNEAPQPFIGIDGIRRDLPAGALLICDTRKPLAIAGIMGGADSAVSEADRTIVIEAAYFDSSFDSQNSENAQIEHGKLAAF